MLLWVSVFVFMLAAPSARSAFFKTTPRFEFAPAMRNLDLKQLNGKWWVYKTIDNFKLPTESVSCSVLNFYVQNGGGITVVEDYISNFQKPTEHSRLKWTLRQNEDSTDVGNFVARKFSHEFGLTEQTYDIIDTDYSTFLYVSTWKPHDYPVPLKPSQRHGSVVLTKRRVLTRNDVEAIEVQLAKTIYKNKIESFFYSNIDNSGCQDDIVFPSSADP